MIWQNHFLTACSDSIHDDYESYKKTALDGNVDYVMMMMVSWDIPIWWLWRFAQEKLPGCERGWSRGRLPGGQQWVGALRRGRICASCDHFRIILLTSPPHNRVITAPSTRQRGWGNTMARRLCTTIPTPPRCRQGIHTTTKQLYLYSKS